MKMSRQPDVIVLDTRSAFRYGRIHLKGAKNLSLPDFTQENLRKVIPSEETTVLIYCNIRTGGARMSKLFHRSRFKLLLLVLLVLLFHAGPEGRFGMGGLERLAGARPAWADPQGIKYTGAGRCAALTCHGSPTPKLEGTTRHNENNHWSSKDEHAKAYASLLKEESKKMAQVLKLEATKSERCLNCHALSGISLAGGVQRLILKPGELDPEKYSIEDGVSCDACHGPGAKYLEPHAKLGWTQAQRNALGSPKLFDEWGLYDTKNLKYRANTCVSCHLKIDHDLLAAGHPRLPFELNLYSTGEWIHWKDKEKWYGVKAWAMGQAVSLREAAQQLEDRLARKAEAAQLQPGYRQLVAHALLSRQLTQVADPESLKALDGALASLHAGWPDPGKAGAALKGLAQAAEALADKVNARNFDQAAAYGLIQGVEAEGEAAGKAGFEAAEQYSLSLSSLWGIITTELEAVKDAEPIKGKIEALFDPLGDPGTFKQAEFIAAAKALAGLFPGGKSLPLPPGGPGTN